MMADREHIHDVTTDAKESAVSHPFPASIVHFPDIDFQALRFLGERMTVGILVERSQQCQKAGDPLVRDLWFARPFAVPASPLSQLRGRLR